MSLAFSDTTTKKGIIQLIEKEIGAEYGHISGNTNRLKEATVDVNMAWDIYLPLAFKANGSWQFDDTNQTDYPVIKTNLVDGQRDYTFTTDEGGNLILDIYKVAILPSATATLYEVIYPVDVQSGEGGDILTENTTEGVPYHYDKTANGIFLDPIPSYNATNGLKIYINREPSYFTTSDTTKKPGCPGVHHRYFAIRAAYDYARRNNLTILSRLYEEVISYEGDEEKGITGSIERYFANRERDQRDVLQGEPIIFQ
jgi:hypothetical protein